MAMPPDKRELLILRDVVDVGFPEVHNYIADGWALLEIETAGERPVYRIGWPKKWSPWHPGGVRPNDDR